VEILLSDELRLTYALLLQAAILAGAWRFVQRRLSTDWADLAADVLLLSLLVQYAAVTLPGLLGILSPLTIAFTTLALSAALFFAKHGQTSLPMPRLEPALDRCTVIACACFALGYMLALNLNQCIWPVMANDALTYHFPAAALWLRTGHLTLLETWFFNPANTYSPLAGSTFVAWWMAPIGNDVLARNVQSPALLLIFFAALRLMRSVGVRTSVAALLALALLLARPFVRQSIIEKDDLYLVAFFSCAAAAFAYDRLGDPLGPWRVGVALLALPALLLLIDAPFRARWPLLRYAITLGVVLLLAGPWYLRNLLLTGNPLYPIQVKLLGVTLFPGLLASARSTQLTSVPSVWALLTGRDQSLPLWPMLLVMLGWFAALVRQFRGVRSDPLTRLCLLGPAIALVVFLLTSPYAEVRFVYPAFVLLFAAAAMSFTGRLQLAFAALLLALSALTTFSLDAIRLPLIAELVFSGVVAAGIGLCLTWAFARFPTRRNPFIGSAIATAVLILAAMIYVQWPGYLKKCRTFAIDCYRTQYGPATADAWRFIRDELPPAEPLAYTNTFYIHPLGGFDHAGSLLYIPTRRGITHLHDLPPLPGRLSGEQIVPALAAALTSDTDAEAWLERLAASKATHLIVFRSAYVQDPPELSIIAAHSDRFERLFQNDEASIYRLHR
jgi:hypothetical protein